MTSGQDGAARFPFATQLQPFCSQQWKTSLSSGGQNTQPEFLVAAQPDTSCIRAGVFHLNPFLVDDGRARESHGGHQVESRPSPPRLQLWGPWDAARSHAGLTDSRASTKGIKPQTQRAADTCYQNTDPMAPAAAIQPPPGCRTRLPSPLADWST